MKITSQYLVVDTGGGQFPATILVIAPCLAFIFRIFLPIRAP